jgi:hypothetical protein
MKINHLTNLITAALSFVAFSTVGCAEKDKAIDTPIPPAKELTATTATAPTAMAAAQPSSAVASAKWAEIKDCTYDTRAQFFTGLKQMEAVVDAQISELTAKRAAMKSSVDTKEWDFAMKEMNDARSYLKSVGSELMKANADTWNQQKETVSQAWLRTQAAYDKVKSSTTS